MMTTKNNARVVAASELPPLPEPHFVRLDWANGETPMFAADQMRDYARAVLAAATPAASVPAGYALVPLEPTPAMLEAIEDDALAETSVEWDSDLGSNKTFGDAEVVYRAMLAAAPSPAVQQPAEGGWISVAERLPSNECIAAYVTASGRKRLIRAKYIARFTIEAEGDDCNSEYREDDETEYVMPGWYECIDNWGEYSSCFVNEGIVTHWRELPPLPAAPTQAEG